MQSSKYHLYPTLFLIALFSSCAFFQATGVPKNNIKNTLDGEMGKRPIVLFLGDSLTHGRVSFDYVSELQRNEKFSNYNLVNEGINSRLTYQIIEQFDNIEKLSPDIIFILIGTNDLKATLSEDEFQSYQKKWNLKERPIKETFQKNYLTILQRLRKNKNAKICLISIPPLGELQDSFPFTQSVAYANTIKEIGSKEKLDYLSFQETLVEKLKKSEAKNRKEYKRNVWEMYFAILKYYSTTKSWDDIAEENGYVFLTDGVHLNEHSGKMLASLIADQLERYSIKK